MTCNVSAFGPLEGLGHLVRGPTVGRLAVDGDNLIAGVNAGAEGRRALIGREDVDLIILLLDHHAHAIVMAALVFAKARISLGIVEVGVRVEHLQHAGDGPVVDGVIGLVRRDGLGIVLFDERVDVRKVLEAVAELALILRGLRAHATLQDGAGQRAHSKEEDDGEECAASAGSHRQTNLQTVHTPSA